ncbi:NTPase [Cognataquiflexum rubidum]|uniref:NTPase n=1 Tax=Cognataquiflexum rubidum TaxID=2922273 RepID=UPI001F133FB7|nr:NTPase [Cognataquiflexum rubidum]MCH6236056.1 NTPase [Cognataquiflexum rubidum]
MKYLLALLTVLALIQPAMAQNALPQTFLDGKSVILISNSPQARPLLSWEALAHEFHPALVSTGGDPIAYYELESVVISEEVQAGFATMFSKRMVSSIVILTRKANGSVTLNIGPFSNNKSMVPTNGMWSMEAGSIQQLNETMTVIGQSIKSKNLMVLEVPEFPSGANATASAAQRYLNRNPLNLDIFKLGIPLSGSAGESGYLNTFRYDLLGKSEESVLAEQNAEKNGLQAIFSQSYPHQVEFLTTPKTDAALISERVQFVLMRVEAREADLMENMGLATDSLTDGDRIVVKYYIRFLVRNELYIGLVWDADPDWRKSLENFLNNLKIK